MRISDWSSDVCSSDLSRIGGDDIEIFKRRVGYISDEWRRRQRERQCRFEEVRDRAVGVRGARAEQILRGIALRVEIDHERAQALGRGNSGELDRNSVVEGKGV